MERGLQSDPGQLEHALLGAIVDVLVEQGAEREAACAFVGEHISLTDVRRIVGRHLEEAMADLGYDSSTEVRRAVARGLRDPAEIAAAILAAHEHQMEAMIASRGDDILRGTLAEIIGLLPA